MVDSILARKIDLAGVDVYFFPPHARPTDRPFSQHLSEQAAIGDVSLHSVQVGTHWTGKVAIMDQAWTAVFRPPVFRSRIARDWQATVPLAVGLAMTAATVLYLWLALRRNGQLQALADDLRRTTQDLHRNTERMVYMARHDMLTGLPNRVMLHERLDEAVAGLDRNRQFGVMCLDLDRFKAVNDTLGHAAGDRLLREAAERMRACMRGPDILARVGGDEFVAILHDAPLPHEVAMVARRMIDRLAAPFSLDGHSAAIGVSIGIAFAPKDDGTADALLSKADLALYAAKQGGRNDFRFFDKPMAAGVEQRHVLEADLRRALENDELELLYHPIVSLEHGRVVGFEALARWNHPERGVVMPGELIPLAEERGLMLKLGGWILGRACAQAAAWPKPAYVAVNLSANQLRAEDLGDEVRAALRESGLPPHRLEIEITEAAMRQTSQRTAVALSELRDLGVQIAFDDFGTGFSSLSSLHRCPIDRIKVDQSFVADLGNKPSALAIVRAVVGLGCSLGLATTGEGIETPEQLDTLRALGCTHGQGYLFSEPRPNSAVPRMLGSMDAVAPADT